MTEYLKKYNTGSLLADCISRTTVTQELTSGFGSFRSDNSIARAEQLAAVRFYLHTKVIRACTSNNCAILCGAETYF